MFGVEAPGAALAVDGPRRPLPAIYRLGGGLTEPVAADAETVARAFLEANREPLGIEGASVFSLPLERRYESETAGLTHLVFERRHAGIRVFGGEVLAHVMQDGSLLQVQPGDPWPARVRPAIAAPLTAAEAVAAAAAAVAPGLALSLRVLEPESGAERRTVLASDALRDAVPVRLVWFPRAADVVLAWELYLHLDSQHWFALLVEAASGEVLFSQNLYRDDKPQGSVFRAAGVSNPNLGPPSVESFTGWPASAGDCPAAIYPAQYRGGGLLNRCWVTATETAGNNATACLDADGNNLCDWRASSAQAHFEFAFTNGYAASGDAVADRQAAVTNLFYWNNVLHDWLYGLGFTEAAGNFQADNFGRGGFGGDAVVADAQDGAGLNNANFATPPDGGAPRMQAFLFISNGSYLRRDPAFDGDVIAHEYAHGLTLRLVGGPSVTTDLYLLQSGAMGEGWSDIYAATLTGDPVIGEYISATPATGFRSVAYNNSPHTFGRFGTMYRRSLGELGLLLDLPQVHRDGEIWATVLWDLRTALGKSVFEPLITTALKLTPPVPSMLQARDAILQSAQAMAVDSCAVWTVFAVRGFGASAALNHVQPGLPWDTALSVYEAFDTPVSCGGSPPPAGVTVYFDDMDSGVNGWTAASLWHQTTRRAAGGSKSWWFGQEATGNYAIGSRAGGALTSPPMALATGARIVLEWDHFFQGEGFGRNYVVGSSGFDPWLNYDSGWVQASRDGGGSWETLTTLAHNTGASFVTHKIDISRFAGSTILVRFLFDTLDGVNNQLEGWYVDNVRVRRLSTGTPILSVMPASLSFSASAGGSNPPAQTLAVANLDGGVLNWTATAAGGGGLGVAPPSGTGDGTLAVTVQSAGLAAGTYHGTVTVTAPGASGSPAVVDVTLTVGGPVAEWRMEETGAGAGVTVADSSGNGRHGTSAGYGSATFSGVSGLARALNGITDRVEVGGSTAFSPSSFTLRAWVKLASYPTADGWGVVVANYGGNYQGWYTGVTAAGRVVFSVASLPSSAPWLVSAGTLALQRWYCITTTYDAATREGAIYINGALDARAVFAGFTAQSAAPLTIGRASWFSGYHLHAVFDEVRLLGARQTSAEVLADYQGFPAPPPPPVNTGVIADWRLDDTGATLTDSSGNGRHGTLTAGASTAGVAGAARMFNGAAEDARVAASDAFSPASLTVRAWVKLLAYPEAAGWGVALGNYGGNYQGWYLGVHASGRAIFSASSLPSSSPWLLSASTLALHTWYCLTATYNGASRLATLYINGAADAQATLAGFTPSPSSGVYFARASWYNGYYLNAAIDETRVYPAARTAAEVLADYQSFPAPPPPPPAAAVAEWRLDDSGSAIADSSGNGRHGTARGTTAVAGRRNSARSFNGASDWVEVPPSAALSPSSFTVRLWVKLLALPAGAGFGALVSNYAGNYQGWYLGVHASGRVIFSVASQPANSPWLLSSAALALNTWSHITATYDGTTRAGTIYINGARDGDAVFPGFTAQSAVPLYLGRASWYDGYYLNAVLDEVRLLGARQAAAEVLAEYQSFP